MKSDYSSNLIKVSGRAIIMFSNGTKFCINDSLYSSETSRNLLSFKDIRYNSYYIEINNEGSETFLYITSILSGQKLILEKLYIFSSGLYYTKMRIVETNVVIHQKCAIHQKCLDPNIFMIWHDHLGSIMMHWIIENSHEHPLKNQKIHLPVDYIKVN